MDKPTDSKKGNVKTKKHKKLLKNRGRISEFGSVNANNTRASSQASKKQPNKSQKDPLNTTLQ